MIDILNKFFFEFRELNSQLLIHILFVILAHWFLIFSCFSGILAEIKERTLKNHKSSKISPSLAKLEKNQFQLLYFALFAMIGALIFGEWYLYIIYNLWFVFNIKIILSIMLCIGIIGLIFMHNKWGTRGQKATRLVLILYILFIIILGISIVITLPP